MQYTNPILYGDYSDPDVIRVGEDFYMISSSFTYLPGIPVLHSRDLAHWELIGYAARRLPFARYDRPAHKRGTWAPSLRWHNDTFYVYVCLPDEGLLAFTAQDPAGEWECHVVKQVVGWIDPCPLFDDDGSVWLVHGLAASRIGINNMLFVHRLSPDGLQVLDKGCLVYNGADHGDVTVEGPKFYQRQGKYWILCPAGGMQPGYQLALRADHVTGPYARRVVLRQGDTPINGPHQGGWVTDGKGGDWFIHFQDVDAYGRVPHLQPVDWSDGWPVMGDHGVPVPSGDTRLPTFDGRLYASDDFVHGPGLQWQWQANPNAGWCRALQPGLRLYAAPANSLFEAGQFLSQLMRCRDFDMTARLSLHAQTGDRAGIGMMGYTYHYLALEAGRVVLVRGDAGEETAVETVLFDAPWQSDALCLRMQVRDGRVSFLYGEAEPLTPLGGDYPLTCGGWTSARPGIFAMNTQGAWGGWADVRQVKFTRGENEIL